MYRSPNVASSVEYLTEMRYMISKPEHNSCNTQAEDRCIYLMQNVLSHCHTNKFVKDLLMLQEHTIGDQTSCH